ncbi:MAG: methionyl-tRNA formyltransferase [Clostridiales bacterium]|nr:methionyl-tRNA formyltransferase [Clostridiales bacterium]
MKIVFMGTPEFAAVSLNRLYSDGYDISGVVTQPDKLKNRGMRLGISAVKELALKHGTPIFQPQTLRDGAAADRLRQMKPDLIAVVAYGKLLPQEILSLPALGCINIHGSILPKYRGSAPIQRAVLNGETITGVTSMYMAPEMDAGDIILTRTTEIGEEETAGELFDRLAVHGAGLLSETIRAIANGTAPRIKQNDSYATYAPPLNKEMSPIDWTKSVREILCHIRGLNPWPVATTEINSSVFKVYKAAGTERRTKLPPGSILEAGRDGIEITCADGTVVIKELQAPGGRRMAAADYLRGHPICR